MPLIGWIFGSNQPIPKKNLMVIVNNHANAQKKPQLLPSYDTHINLDDRENTARKVMRPRRPSDSQKQQTAKQKANDRLAQALRDNLHRRKAQARARKAAPSTEAGGTIPSDEKSLKK